MYRIFWVEVLKDGVIHVHHLLVLLIFVTALILHVISNIVEHIKHGVFLIILQFPILILLEEHVVFGFEGFHAIHKHRICLWINSCKGNN